MPFDAPALDQMWVDFLLILGFVLTMGSLITVGLCVLGGCLDMVQRRRDRRVRPGDLASSQVVAGRKAAGIEPAIQVTEEAPFFRPRQSKTPSLVRKTI